MQLYRVLLVNVFCFFSLCASNHSDGVDSRKIADFLKTIDIQKKQIKELQDTIGAQAVKIKDLDYSFAAVCEVNEKICTQRDKCFLEIQQSLEIAESAQKTAQYWKNKYFRYQDRVEKVLNIFLVLGIAYTMCDLYSEYVAKYT